MLNYPEWHQGFVVLARYQALSHNVIKVEGQMKPFLINSRGFTLAEVMVAVAVMGVVTLGIISLTKMQSTQEVKSKVSNDLAQIRSQVAGLLANPAHCNANFYNVTSASVSVTNIYKCSTTVAGGCRNTGTPASEYPVVVTPTTWGFSNTKISDRIKISALTRKVDHIAPPAGVPVVITTGTLIATFLIKISESVIKTETLTFVAPVIYNGTVVTGCPRSWSSTIVY